MRARIYKVFYLATIVLVIALLIGCTKTVYVPVPYNPPPAQAPTTTAIPQPTSTVWTTSGTLGSQSVAYLPSNGAYIQPGTTLSLSWSADGSLNGYIMTSNQFNNYKNNPISITSWASGSGSNGNISVKIQNGDTYYGVVKNATILSPFSNTTITLYKATLTAR